MDGLKLWIQALAGNVKQLLFYNGWTHDHYCTNPFLFTPDGRIRGMCYKAPGCLHDSTLAIWSGLYEKLEDIHKTHDGANVVADSAFAKLPSGAIIKSHQNVMGRNGPKQKPSVNRAATLVRQLSEWGMRALQASFPRLKDCLSYEKAGKRKIILKTIVLLYNFRAMMVVQNQIASVFIPWLERAPNEVYRKV